MYLYLILIKAHILVVGSFGDERFFFCVCFYYMIFLKRLFFQWVWDPGLARARLLLYHWAAPAAQGSSYGKNTHAVDGWSSSHGLDAEHLRRISPYCHRVHHL